jgi:N-methylhydantoinase A/oxoprolinase/acetone carboxylase beta subunit
MSRDGEAVVPLDLGQARAELAYLVDAGVEAIAICFPALVQKPRA